VTEAEQNMAAVAVEPRELHDVYARPFRRDGLLVGVTPWRQFTTSRWGRERRGPTEEVSE
jgi:hypothetical protein